MFQSLPFPGGCVLPDPSQQPVAVLERGRKSGISISWVEFCGIPNGNLVRSLLLPMLQDLFQSGIWRFIPQLGELLVLIA